MQSEKASMSAPVHAVVMRPEWLLAISKAASSIRFTANNWEWMTDAAKAESESIANTLAEIESAYWPRCKECGYTAEDAAIDAAIYLDHRSCSGKIPSA